jgi:hypothetical protein
MAEYYIWFVFVHLVGMVVFLMTHGVSLWVAFRLRTTRDPALAAMLLSMSHRGNQAMYVGLLLLGVGGLGAAAIQGWLVAPWAITSYVVLAIVAGIMYGVAGTFYYPLRDALSPKEGVQPIGAEELARRVDNRRPEILTAVGGLGLLILVWLMVIKPGA